MRVLLLPFTASIVLFASAGKFGQPRCPTVAPWLLAGKAAPICNIATKISGADTMSLLQSRGIQVDFGDEGLDAPSSKQNGAPAVDLSRITQFGKSPEEAKLLDTQNQSWTSISSGWSIVFFTGTALVLCWGLCATIGAFQVKQVEQDQLESRITDVLQPKQAGKGEKPNSDPTPRASLISVASPLPKSWLSPKMGSKTPSSVDDLARTQDMPPQLSQSNVPLASEVCLQVAKDAMTTQKLGVDIALVAAGRPLMRACVRQVDGELWLELSMHAEGSTPNAMTRLTSKESPNPSWAGLKTKTKAAVGPEIFGPDGSFYGTIERCDGGGRLILSTTAQPVMTLSGDISGFEFVATTPKGIALARVDSVGGVLGRPGSINIRLQKGTDLALVASTVLAMMLLSTT